MVEAQGASSKAIIPRLPTIKTTQQVHGTARKQALKNAPPKTLKSAFVPGGSKWPIPSFPAALTSSAWRRRLYFGGAQRPVDGFRKGRKGFRRAMEVGPAAAAESVAEFLLAAESFALAVLAEAGAEAAVAPFALAGSVDVLGVGVGATSFMVSTTLCSLRMFSTPTTCFYFLYLLTILYSTPSLPLVYYLPASNFY